MKKIAITTLGILAAISLGAAVGCSDSTGGDSTPTAAPQTLVNGGFESADLSGWTLEYGNAFDDDCVSSVKTFSFADDENQNALSINHTGNWYLCGKAFDNKYSSARTGAMRSTKFTLGGDGCVSVKLAGGAVRTGKGDAPKKALERRCYFGVYRAEDDKMIARQENEYFLEHTESYVNPSKYSAGVYNTDNFYEYSIDLSEYIGEELYVRIVDNDESHYYGYFCVDDIRIGGEDSQQEGAEFVKTRVYQASAEAENMHEIVNGGFETGSLAGWTIVEGTAFSNEGVNTESVWWNENITYSRDGNYHYGHYNPTATGIMRSSEFVLGGSGYVSYKLGGCADNARTFLRFMLKDSNGAKEIARFSNFKYWNFQFPFVPNGMRLLNMVQYYVDFSAYIGETMYIEVIDTNQSADDLACITLDSVKTYWAEKPIWYDSEAYEARINSDVEIVSPYQVKNGTFETGNLEGWTPSWTQDSERIGYVTDAGGWWNQNFPYNKKGNYLFTGIADESKVGTLTSSAFTVGGSGYITYLLGGGGDPSKCYLSVIDVETGTELARFANRYFYDLGTSLLNRGSNLANMIFYKADLSAFIGKEVRLQLVDNATNSWGLLTADSFITYYATQEAVPSTAWEAMNILPKTTLGADSEYQVLNGDFETGDLTGWTMNGNIAGISRDEVWWNEWFDFNKDGVYFVNGWVGEEIATGTLTSSTFTVGGCGMITFKLGGGKNTELCRVEIVDSATDDVLAVYGNTKFAESSRPYYYNGKPIDLAKEGVYKANMVEYKADLSAYSGRQVYIRIVDEATQDWGLLFVDSFITYYAELSSVSQEAVLAENLKK